MSTSNGIFADVLISLAAWSEMMFGELLPRLTAFVQG